MALDGVFLYCLIDEISKNCINSRVEKIYQPTRDEIVFVLRSKEGACKLLMSVRANSPRLQLTDLSLENPLSPPMFCMLLRKHLSAARLSAITQQGTDRVCALHFEGYNEFGDPVTYRLVVEIMGRHSNIIFVGPEGKIIDCIKRVDLSMSSARQVLPGLLYQQPPAQDKLSLLQHSPDEIVAAVKTGPSLLLSKALLACIQGISPLISREIMHYVGRGKDIISGEITEEEQARLRFFLSSMRDLVENGSYGAYLIEDGQKKPVDFAFMPIHQYGMAMTVRQEKTLSDLLDVFYQERDSRERIHQKGQDILRLLANATSRLSRKLDAQRAELKACENRDQAKIYGDLISTYLGQIEKGQPYADLENYYDQCRVLRVPLDVTKSPAQNAQKYYKEYRKAATAQKVLTEQIARGEAELLYLDSVFDSLSRAQTERELGEIRQELSEQGYLKKSRQQKKAPGALPPMAFRSSDGFRILVGRNNRQNDRLTLKDSQKNDLWFHVKDVPGSHTVVVANGQSVPDRTLEEAAMLAAYHSTAKDSTQVAVDYTRIKHVKKPVGAKPGMVIYDNFKTAFVRPSNDFPVEK